jgi:hypothetical protein
VVAGREGRLTSPDNEHVDPACLALVTHRPRARASPMAVRRSGTAR